MGKIKKTNPKTELKSFIFIALLLCSIFTGAIGADVSSSVAATNTDAVSSDPPSGTPLVILEAESSPVDFVDLGQWSTTVDGAVSHALIQGPDGKVYGGTHAGHDRNAHLFSYEPDVGFTDLGQVPPDSPDIYVSAITVHSNGNLYIGTSDRGHLVKYDPNTGTMETRGNNVAGGSYINQLREGSGGKIYGTTAPNGHLFSYDPDSGAIDDLGQVASGERALFGLAFDASGDCIFLTSSQSAHGGTASMYRYNLTTQETTSFGLLVPDARWS
jgi:outer membrane protein assembly factor BamB